MEAYHLPHALLQVRERTYLKSAVFEKPYTGDVKDE